MLEYLVERGAMMEEEKTANDRVNWGDREDNAGKMLLSSPE